jgi:2-polyprenyl-6-methoxyphenol hydroxylase-like FAD-dependent oxidoreductase
MTFVNSGIHEFSLSPYERKRRQELAGAVHVIQNAIQELQSRLENDEPNLRARELVLNSSKALSTIKQMMDAQNKPIHN